MAPKPLSRRSTLLMTAAGLAAGWVPAAGADSARRQKGWRNGQSLPFPVQEIYPALHAGRIHLAGGFIAEDGRITGPTAMHHAYDPASGNWTVKAPLPAARHHPQLISYRGRLYCIGGYEAGEQGGWQMRGGVWRYDDAEDAWSAAPAMPVPNGESISEVADGLLFVIGGRHPRADRNLDWNDQTDVATAWAFDGSKWFDTAPMPTARNSAASGVINGYIHVIGGRPCRRRRAVWPLQPSATDCTPLAVSISPAMAGASIPMPGSMTPIETGGAPFPTCRGRAMVSAPSPLAATSM